MAADATLAIRKAIVSAVKGDPALAALGVTNVLDFSPDRTVPMTAPLVVFGARFAVTDDLHGILGQETFIHLDVYDRSRGSVLVDQILAALHTLLHRSRLTVVGHEVMAAFRVLQRVNVETDGVTVHGLAQYRFVTHE